MNTHNPTKSTLDKQETSSFSSNVIARPSREVALKTAQDTKLALEQLLQSRSTSTALNSQPQYFGSEQKAIQVVSRPVDPLAPPKFKVKKVQKAIVSTPAPVLHSPPRIKASKELQASWKIPPAISNWKNPKGFTISLDKRTMRDSLSTRPDSIQDSFGKMAEALAVAEQQARQELEMRAALQRKQATQERQFKEEELRLMAQRARESLATAEKRPPPERRHFSSSSIPHAHKQTKDSSETLHHQSLYDRDAGISSGFADDEDYNLYDRPMFGGQAKRAKTTFSYTGTNLAHHSNQQSKDQEYDAQPQDRPIQFERDDSSSAADPFGVESFLTQARKGKQQ
jgi:hypothetical protein